MTFPSKTSETPLETYKSTTEAVSWHSTIIKQINIQTLAQSKWQVWGGPKDNCCFSCTERVCADMLQVTELSNTYNGKIA